ncbi:MAG: TolC family protein [bacterium]
MRTFLTSSGSSSPTGSFSQGSQGILPDRCKALVLIAGLGLISGGCLTPAPPPSSVTPWKPPASTASADIAWTNLRAETNNLSGPLSLAEVVDLALQNHPASQRAWRDARAAAEQARQVRGNLLPAVNATAGVSIQRTMANTNAFDREVLTYSPGLQVNYLIFSFGGGRFAAIEQARQTVHALNFSFNRAIQDVLLGAETAYYSLVSSQAGVEAALSSIKDARTTLAVAEESLRAGLGTELEVLQAQAALDQAAYNLAAAEGLAKVASGALALAMGLPADTAVQIEPPARDVPDSLAAADVRRLIDDSLGRRPDIAALRATLAAREAAVKVAGSQLWPSLYFNGTASRNYYDKYGTTKMQDDDWALYGGVSLQWALFDGFQASHARKASAEQAESVRAQLRQVELVASAEVWVRYQGYETALKKFAFSAAYLKSASASHQKALDSYKAGLRTILDLLNAEAQLAQARQQNVAARQEAFTALVQLAYSTGLLERGSLEQAGGNLFSIPTRKDNQP